MPDTRIPPSTPRPQKTPDRLGMEGAGPVLRAAAALLSTLLNFAFNLLYHPLAFSYDLVAWIVSAGEWAEWRRCVLPFLLPGPVLEIAHGTGTLSLDMADRGYPVTAIDLSPEMGSIALGKKRSWLAQKQPGNGSPLEPWLLRSVAGPALVRADVRRLPLQEGYFASAVATFPADFLFQIESAREVHRALRPGGRWIILPTAYPEWIAERVLRNGDAHRSGAVWRAVTDPLEKTGFRVRTEIVRRPRSRVVLIVAEKVLFPA